MDWKVAVIVCVSFFMGYVTCGLLSFNDRFGNDVDLENDDE